MLSGKWQTSEKLEICTYICSVFMSKLYYSIPKLLSLLTFLFIFDHLSYLIFKKNYARAEGVGRRRGVRWRRKTTRFRLVFEETER
jgi:hypothetical protein